MRTPIKVFILAGQSNMVGSDAHAAKIDSYPTYKGAGATQPDVRFTSLPELPKAGFQGWTPLTPNDAFGPEVTFARAVTKTLKQPIAIIKSAIGGTTAAYDWNPDAPESGQKLYPRTLELIRGALKNLTEQGIPYTIEGVLWHQGENDMLDRRVNGNYAANLTRIIQQFRTDLDIPDLKWFMGEVSTKGIWGMDNRSNMSILRKQQQQVLDSDKHITFVPTSHLAFDVMGSGQPHYHFGTQGQLQMGNAFAAAYLGKTGKTRVLTRRPSPKFPPKGTRVHLVVLVGQRNAEGDDAFIQDISSSPAVGLLAKPDERILFRYSIGGGAQTSNSWESLAPVSSLATFGPELSLGKRLRENIPMTDGIAILKFTHSGAQIADWLPGSPEAERNVNQQLIAFITAAVNDLTKRGYTVIPAGICWHAGENDTYYSPYIRDYAARLQQLATSIRVTCNAPNMSFICSEQHPKSPWVHINEMNAQLAKLSDGDKNTTVLPTASIPHGKVHFGAAGTVALGELYADAILKRLKS